MLSTSECILTDLLECGTADLCMLDDLYGVLADEIYNGDRKDMLKRGGDLNGILYEFYSDISIGVIDDIDTLIEDFRDAEDNTLTDFYDILVEIIEEQGKKATKAKINKAIEEIERQVDRMRNTYPYTNCLDSHFQNDLDQTIDFDNTLRGNSVLLMKYWLR